MSDINLPRHWTRASTRLGMNFRALGLTFDAFGVLQVATAYAGVANKGGRIDASIDIIREATGLPQARFDAAWALLVETEHLHEEEGRWHASRWESEQPPTTECERVRKHRGLKRSRNVTETLQEPGLPDLRNVTTKSKSTSTSAPREETLKGKSPSNNGASGAQKATDAELF